MPISTNEKFYFKIDGFCPCCDQNVSFESMNSWLRDHFYCTNCGSIPRERALMLVIEKYYPNWREMTIHESSPIYRSASKKLKDLAPGYIGTHYFPNEERSVTINGFRNEDLENLTFDTESFDLTITQDVMEHIYNPSNAFKEIARTLKFGGAHIFTVPIINRHKKSEIWAIEGVNNKPLFLKTPEYHGNPISENGSPVTMHWGFDIVDFIRNVSYLDTIIEHIDDLQFGIRAEFIEVLISVKMQ